MIEGNGRAHDKITGPEYYEKGHLKDSVATAEERGF